MYKLLFLDGKAMREIKILGHRGCVDGTVYQNTIEAFEVGMKCGGIETDVCLSADNQIYFVHDTLYVYEVVYDFYHHLHPEDRDKPKGKRLDQLDSSFIDTLHLNYSSKPKIPTWNDLICLHYKYPESIINLELKGHDTARAVYEALKCSDVDASKFILSSFNHPELLKFRQLAGGQYKIAALMALPFQEKEEMHPWDTAPDNQKGYYTPLKPEFFVEGCRERQLLDQINPDFFNIGQRIGLDDDGQFQSEKYDDVGVTNIEMIKSHFPYADIILWALVTDANPEKDEFLIKKIENLVQKNFLYAYITTHPREFKKDIKNRGLITVV